MSTQPLVNTCSIQDFVRELRKFPEAVPRHGHEEIARFMVQYREMWDRWENPIKKLIARFGVIRFMDFAATNWNQQAEWSDRVTPDFYSQAVTPPNFLDTDSPTRECGSPFSLA